MTHCRTTGVAEAPTVHFNHTCNKRTLLCRAHFVHNEPKHTYTNDMAKIHVHHSPQQLMPKDQA